MVLQVRAIISDFAVMIAIVSMVLFDFLLGLPTPKLLVPDQVQVRTRPPPTAPTPFSI